MVKIARYKTTNHYGTIKLPTNIMDMIDTIHELEGFTSRTDVLKHIVRNHYNKLITKLEKMRIEKIRIKGI